MRDELQRNFTGTKQLSAAIAETGRQGKVVLRPAVPTGPALRPLFKGDMGEQGRKLMTMITFVVNDLDNLASMLAAIQQTGKHHAGDGVTPAHYDTAGSVLVRTLGQGLGVQLSPAVQSAWVKADQTLSSAMQHVACVIPYSKCHSDCD